MSFLQQKSKIIDWLKKNLFGSWISGIVTCLFAIITIFIAKAVLKFIFVTAKWDVIPANLKILMVGQYTASEVWRVWLSLSVVVFLLGVLWGIKRGIIKAVSFSIIAIFAITLLLPFVSIATRVWAFTQILLTLAGFWIGHKFKFIKKYYFLGWLLSVPIILILLNGVGNMKDVNTNLWGGFLLTVLIAVVDIVLSFPIGVLLALGRRSKLVVIRWFCIIYIEVIRGVPLITVLFGAQLLLPLFLGNGLELNNVLRVMIGFTLFNAAYVAETVRGGMQIIPQGQYEAAQALGLNYVQRITFVIMPQALRSVVPALVGSVIEVFKDTSLVAIVSLMDLLGIAKRVVANPQFLGRQMEVFLFVAAVFFVICTVISKISKRMEVSSSYGKV
ncbi:polar amino acid ABC transporter, inner membrane subunit [Ruminiclostridium papyrosolvens DSM 2782]|uniref:Polar amino acid ABC transporter, inner membrane subunit n=2 Tax=Ruminiclostridium papyrosolvens TaxID=29362 RepID=F1TI23_9FIRM|nr:amino acid ABC transporter permease [Ruminiclostridium papyrosolvens]EGD45958.1 polar amino acid ABC transporter, inner membrane subunit [Ruminiclostridium papyrosolvens DSM 2782]